MSAFEQSAEERRLLLERAKRRAELRAEFLKQTSNPFRHGEGGTVFDPSYIRHQAMRVNATDHFKPTWQTFRILLFFGLPMVAYGFWVKNDRDKREREFRSGEVAYKDRRFKFI